MSQSNMQTIQIETKNNSTYKYHQIQVNTTFGLSGELKLNGDKIHDFNDQPTQLSGNLELKQLKDGVNKLVLSISKIPVDIELGYFDEAVFTIVFHAINEKMFPSKETALFKILWNPQSKQTEAEIEYLFNLNLE
ncbi:hypothetical protein [Maribacter antarcticus]|uniref:hypothetical protein n=1 Tax=Maribacter antarcticus TaxID=505250 RepID=UPI00047868EF|nr:hypothetical protein [Maribacter antarcticus]